MSEKIVITNDYANDKQVVARYSTQPASVCSKIHSNKYMIGASLFLLLLNFTAGRTRCSYLRRFQLGNVNWISGPRLRS